MERFHLAVLAAAPFLVTLILTLGASPCASQKKGFQSLNCGGGYLVDNKSGIVWTEDPFTNQSNELLYGSVGKVDFDSDDVTSVMMTLRYFPRESRNKKFCYSSFQVSSGNTYLVRASFLYGNYDHLHQPPTFLLIINYNIWTSVNTSLSPTPIVEELIFVSTSDVLNICVATSNSTNHTPFISTLELRPLASTMYAKSQLQLYSTALSQGFGLQLRQRINYGAKSDAITRFPVDPYDRMWEGNTTGPRVSMNASKVGLSYGADDGSETPREVLSSAITVEAPQDNLSFTYELAGRTEARVRVELHFEEVDVRASAPRSRLFYVAFPNSGDALFELGKKINEQRPIYPSSAGPIALSFDQLIPLPLRITFFRDPSSVLGPLLNAVELFYWTDQSLSASGTNQGDVYALTIIQTHFNLSGNGQGDPCMPKGYEWTWITCNDDIPPRIIGINLSNLNLIGDVPPSINNLSSLQSIDLSRNMLNGSLPDISNLKALNYIDISYNNFCGRLPTFQGPTYNFTGNNGLCDDPKCDCNARALTNMNAMGQSSAKKYILAICIIGALYLAMLIAFFFILKAKFGGKAQDKATSSMQENRNVFGADNLKGLPYFVKMFTYNEISRATLNFTTVLGEGGFGKVYHGLLETGEAIAVKSLADASKQGLKEFYNEVAILSRVRHKNLVCLLGCCVENTCMLIYEYMEKGNLKDLLYGDMESTERPLSWIRRLQIALDASKGLEYLHMGCDPPIIHRDVKTSNILLSDKMQAKLADFGLSRLKEGDNNASHISTINVVGTPGYLDPAYNATNQLTNKSDVYSFGIVLLELICGRAPIDMFTEPPHIVGWATSSIKQGRIEEIVDPMLANEYKVESLWKALDVAIGCVEDDRMKRPKMTQVFQALQDALEIEMNKRSSPSSRDTSGSSSTSDEKISTLHYIRSIQAKLQPR